MAPGVYDPDLGLPPLARRLVLFERKGSVGRTFNVNSLVAGLLDPYLDPLTRPGYSKFEPERNMPNFTLRFIHLGPPGAAKR